MGNRRLKKGEVLFLQGTFPKELYLLESGAVEILYTPAEFEGLDKNIILEKSKRCGFIKAKSILAGFSDLEFGNYKRTLRALDECQVSKYPLKKDGFNGIIQADPKQAVAIFRQIYNRLNQALNDVMKYKKVYSMLSVMDDNLAIMYKDLSGNSNSDELHARATAVYETFTANNGNLPDQYSIHFLVNDLKQYLNKTYELSDSVLNSGIDRQLLNFVIKFLKINPSILMHAMKADPSIGETMHNLLSQNLVKTLGTIVTCNDYINAKLRDLFSHAPSSWSHYLVDGGGLNEWVERGKVTGDFSKNLGALLDKLNAMYMSLQGVALNDTYPGVNAVKQFSVQVKPQGAVKQPAGAAEKAGGSTSKGPAIPAVISSGALKRSLHQIFEFAIIDKDFQNKFIKVLNEFKNLKNPMTTDSDSRKVRRHLTKFYWDLYKQVFIRSKSESNIPRPVKFMINYGYIDEDLVEEEQIENLNEFARMRERTRNVPVLMENEFLSMVFAGKVEPSITEMGLDYKNYLREQEKHSSRKKKGEEIITADENMKKVMYEIENRLASTAAVCSGSTATAFPVLTSHAIRGSLDNVYVHKEEIERAILELHEIDFSVFYRETVLKLGDAREIIMEEVIPYFVLLPIFGTKTLLWQELSGTNKRSRGRIFIPIFFLGDLKRSLAHTLACFRWELNRSLKGAMWADPIEGGVTGEYFDYVNTYKKNSKLSEDAKQKIHERFKALRTNRDRFADDYLMWVFFERDGIMKLNTVVREMFYKHIPFRKDIREKLGNMPAFSHPANRYANILARTVAQYQRRFKKYQGADGAYPDEIEKFFKYLEM